MIKKYNLDKIIKFVIFSNILLFFFTSLNAVLIDPNVDADISYNDSSKGIWWSEFSIYAKTGISVGDIIEIPYVSYDVIGESFDLFPLFLKLKDTDIIICVNEFLDNIVGYEFYPLCFYNVVDIFENPISFTYSVRESQSLFSYKEYDILWGKNVNYYLKKDKLLDSGLFNLNNINYDGNYYVMSESNIVANADSQSTPAVDSPASQLQPEFVGVINSPGYFSQVPLSAGVSSSGCGITCTAKIYKNNILINSQSNSCVERDKRVYLDFTKESYSSLYEKGDSFKIITDCGSSYRPYLSVGDVSKSGGAFSFTNQRPIIYEKDSAGNYPAIYKYDTKVYSDSNIETNDISIFTNHSKLSLYMNVNNNEIKPYIKLSNDSKYFFETNGEFLHTIDLTSKYFKFGVDFSNPNEPLKLHKNILFSIYGNGFKIFKEEDDSVNGMNLVPYKTNNQYANFLNFKDILNNVLWFDLNYFDSPILTNDLDDYLQTGNNEIKLEKVNNEGGFWLFFEGQYNTQPTLSPGPTLDTTGGLELIQSINCQAGTYQDADSDPQTNIEFGWWKNNVQTAITTQGTSVTSLSAVKGDSIKCGQRVSDEFGQSSWYYTTELNVIGAKPTGNLSITPISPAQGQDVTCTVFNLQDADLDPVTAELFWLEDNTIILANTTANNLTLNSSLIDNEKAYSCVATLDDTTAKINISKSFGVGNVPPTITRDLSLDTSYAFDNYVFSSFGALAEDVNDDTITYTYEYSTDKGNWTTAITTQSSSFEWDTSSISEGTYYIRYKASDSQSSSPYKNLSNNISIKKYNIELITNTDSLYSTRFKVSSGASIANVHYSNGDIGFLAGDDSNNGVYEVIVYLPEIFDGVRRLKEFEFTPKLAYSNGVSTASGSVNNYDILVYAVDSTSQLPTGSPILTYFDQVLKIGSLNSFPTDVLVPADKLVAIKICRNVNEISYECNSDSNGKEDALIIKGLNGLGTYPAKVKQGSNSFSNANNLDVGFDWEREALEKVKVKVDISYPDEMIPVSIIKRNSDDVVCGTNKVSLKKGVPECIQSLGNNQYLIYTDKLSADVQYDILGGRELQFSGAGSETVTILKSNKVTQNLRLEILGAELLGSFPSSPNLRVNSNSFWSTTGEFSTAIKTNPLNSVWVNGENRFDFTSSSSGELVFWLQPLYTNLNVIHDSFIEPKENALSQLDVSVSTDFDFDVSRSYCAFSLGGILKTKSSLSGQNGNYVCTPTLKATDLAGQYLLTVHTEDVTGFVDEYKGTVSYSELKALSVGSFDFDTLDFTDTNRKVKANVKFSNSGNIDINKVLMFAKLDKFWDEPGDKYFDITDLLFFAKDEKSLESQRDRHEFDLVKDHDMLLNLTGTLTPGQVIEVAFELNVPLNVAVDEYIGEFGVEYE